MNKSDIKELDMEKHWKTDLGQIINAAAEEVMGVDLFPRRGWMRVPEMIAVTPDNVRAKLVDSVMALAREEFEGRDSADEPLAAEKAVAALMRSGVPKEKVRFRKNSFRVTLPHGEYRIYKKGTGVYAGCGPSDRRYLFNFGGEEFAKFLLRFDAAVPDMEARVPDILAVLRTRVMEEMKRRKAQEVRDTVVRTLVKSHLAPLGIAAEYTVGDSDTVSMNLTRVFKGHVDVPFAQLAEVLTDTASILASLSVEPPNQALNRVIEKPTKSSI